MDWLRSKWRDPVWSKVISAGIVALVGLVFSAAPQIRTLISSNITMPLWVPLAVMLVVIAAFPLIRMMLRKKQPGSPQAQRATLQQSTYADDVAATIESHRDGNLVKERLDRFGGTLNKSLPDNYRLWIVRRWRTKIDAFYPVGRCEITQSVGQTGYQWELVNCYVGGSAAKHDVRFLEVWLSGPDGDLLMDTWGKAQVKYAQLMEDTQQTWTSSRLFPGISAAASDMKMLTKVSVTRN